MALEIVEVKVTPNPVPSDAALVRATCRIKSDTPLEAVTAFPPEGPPIPFRKQEEDLFVLESSVPPGAMSGTYDVVVVARDSEGKTARTTVPVTIT